MIYVTASYCGCIDNLFLQSSLCRIGREEILFRFHVQEEISMAVPVHEIFALVFEPSFCFMIKIMNICRYGIRGKSAGSKEQSKFYLLKRTGAAKPVGMIKGVVHSAEFGPKGLVIGTEAGDNLELKVYIHR